MDRSGVFHKTHHEFDPWRNVDLTVSRVRPTYFDFSGETEINRIYPRRSRGAEKRTRPVSLEQIEKTVKNLPSEGKDHMIL